MMRRRAPAAGAAAPCAVTLFDAAHCVSAVSPRSGTARLLRCSDAETAALYESKQQTDGVRQKLKALAVLVGGQRLGQIPSAAPPPKRRRKELGLLGTQHFLLPAAEVAPPAEFTVVRQPRLLRPASAPPAPAAPGSPAAATLTVHPQQQPVPVAPTRAQWVPGHSPQPVQSCCSWAAVGTRRRAKGRSLNAVPLLVRGGLSAAEEEEEREEEGPAAAGQIPARPAAPPAEDGGSEDCPPSDEEPAPRPDPGSIATAIELPAFVPPLRQRDGSLGPPKAGGGFLLCRPPRKRRRYAPYEAEAGGSPAAPQLPQRKKSQQPAPDPHLVRTLAAAAAMGDRRGRHILLQNASAAARGEAAAAEDASLQQPVREDAARAGSDRAQLMLAVAEYNAPTDHAASPGYPRRGPAHAPVNRGSPPPEPVQKDLRVSGVQATRRRRRFKPSPADILAKDAAGPGFGVDEGMEGDDWRHVVEARLVAHRTAAAPPARRKVGRPPPAPVAPAPAAPELEEEPVRPAGVLSGAPPALDEESDQSWNQQPELATPQQERTACTEASAADVVAVSSTSSSAQRQRSSQPDPCPLLAIPDDAGAAPVLPLTPEPRSARSEDDVVALAEVGPAQAEAHTPATVSLPQPVPAAESEGQGEAAAQPDAPQPELPAEEDAAQEPEAAESPATASTHHTSPQLSEQPTPTALPSQQQPSPPQVPDEPPAVTEEPAVADAAAAAPEPSPEVSDAAPPEQQQPSPLVQPQVDDSEPPQVEGDAAAPASDAALPVQRQPSPPRIIDATSPPSPELASPQAAAAPSSLLNVTGDWGNRVKSEDGSDGAWGSADMDGFRAFEGTVESPAAPAARAPSGSSPRGDQLPGLSATRLDPSLLSPVAEVGLAVVAPTPIRGMSGELSAPSVPSLQLAAAAAASGGGVLPPQQHQASSAAGLGSPGRGSHLKRRQSHRSAPPKRPTARRRQSHTPPNARRESPPRDKDRASLGSGSSASGPPLDTARSGGSDPLRRRSSPRPAASPPQPSMVGPRSGARQPSFVELGKRDGNTSPRGRKNGSLKSLSHFARLSVSMSDLRSKAAHGQSISVTLSGRPSAELAALLDDAPVAAAPPATLKPAASVRRRSSVAVPHEDDDDDRVLRKGTRAAVVIGVSKLADRRVPECSNVIADVEHIAATLHALGFKVALLHDGFNREEEPLRQPTRSNILSKIEELREGLSSRWDSMLVYYQGMGHSGPLPRDSRKNLPAAGALVGDPVLFTRDTTMSVNFLQESSRMVKVSELAMRDKPHSNIVIADAAGLFGPGTGVVMVGGRDTAGGRLRAEYGRGQQHVLSFYLRRALQGVAVRDHRITPNSLNVYLDKKLRQRGAEVSTNASSLTVGDVVLADRADFSRKWDKKVARDRRILSRDVPTLITITGAISRRQYEGASPVFVQALSRRLHTLGKCRGATQERRMVSKKSRRSFAQSRSRSVVGEEHQLPRDTLNDKGVSSRGCSSAFRFRVQFDADPWTHVVCGRDQWGERLYAVEQGLRMHTQDRHFTYSQLMHAGMVYAALSFRAAVTVSQFLLLTARRPASAILSPSASPVLATSPAPPPPDTSPSPSPRRGSTNPSRLPLSPIKQLPETGFVQPLPIPSPSRMSAVTATRHRSDASTRSLTQINGVEILDVCDEVSVTFLATDYMGTKVDRAARTGELLSVFTAVWSCQLHVLTPEELESSASAVAIQSVWRAHRTRATHGRRAKVLLSERRLRDEIREDEDEMTADLHRAHVSGTRWLVEREEDAMRQDKHNWEAEELSRLCNRVKASLAKVESAYRSRVEANEAYHSVLLWDGTYERFLIESQWLGWKWLLRRVGKVLQGEISGRDKVERQERAAFSILSKQYALRSL
eukprot:TRINITY_DN4365_c1_g2_i1.p1 TRINITY_DN4365_c1_g2~~TRINITY_DN4365_c1_g2_i1.p1  ORF type:complete len:1877 (+),score=507.16 TRINITY_DN4365_c1_g2_i1:94-5724(+)